MRTLVSLSQYVLFFLFILLMFSCSQQRVSQNSQNSDNNFDDSGIIYLEEDEAGASQKKATTNTKTTQQTQKDKSGIVYLSEAEQQASVQKKAQQVSKDAQYGKASYYADKFQGRRTASGELYNRDKMTAAHRTLPFGTICRVTNVKTGKSVEVRVNDRGPFSKNRVIDISYKAMSSLGGIHAGLIDVKVEVVK